MNTGQKPTVMILKKNLLIVGKLKRFFILNYLSVLNHFQYTSNTKQNYLDFGGTKTKIIS